MASDFLSVSFTAAAIELTNRNSKKSYAQVASSVAPHVTPAVSHVGVPHAAGLRPIPHQRKTSCTRSFRLRHDEMQLIEKKAKAYRMSVNAYVRAKALGEDYIEKPPEWLRDTLLKLYVELAGQGNNLNQIARQVNRQMTSAEAALAMVDRQRQPVFHVLEKLEHFLCFSPNMEKSWSDSPFEKTAKARRTGAAADPRNVSRSKWGDAIDAGFQVLPDVLLKYQHTLDLTPTDVVVTINLTMLWWYVDSPPFPTTVTIGRRMGVAPRTVQRSLQRLESLGLVRKIRGKKNKRAEFDLTPLADRLKGLARNDPTYGLRLSVTNGDSGVHTQNLA